MRCATPRYSRQLTPGERRQNACKLAHSLNCHEPPPGWSVWSVEAKEPFRTISWYRDSGYAVVAVPVSDGLRFLPYNYWTGALAFAQTDSHTARQIVERAARTAQEERENEVDK